MASKVYTAQELREMVNYAMVATRGMRGWCVDNERSAALQEMLRQAADALDRKKKYEYTLKYLAKDGSCYVSRFHNDTQDEAERYSNTFNGETFVVLRRQVGEWEEVKV